MGWFGEQVPDSPLEAWRVRRVHLLVYLEDGSMQARCTGQSQCQRSAWAALPSLEAPTPPSPNQLSPPPHPPRQVTEPPETNSGLVQGTLVRRHKLAREGGGVLGIADLAVGASIKIYGREVHLVDADAFTREQAAARGAPLAPALPYPASPYEQALAAKSKPSGALLCGG